MSIGILSFDREEQDAGTAVRNTQQATHARIAHTVGKIFYYGTETGSILGAYGVSAIANGIVQFTRTLFNRR